MEMITGLEMFERMTGLGESMRKLSLITQLPAVEAAMKADPDIEWAVALLIEAGFTPETFEIAYELRKPSKPEVPSV